MATHGQRIGELAVGKSIVIEKLPAGGSLEARRLRSGAVTFYWRHTEQSRTAREPIGNYDPGAPPKSLKPTTRGFSVQAALERARELARQNLDTPGGLRAAKQRQEAAARAESEAATARQRYTLAALCADYCAFLRGAGKSSWRDAENIFQNHLAAPFPDLLARPAAMVEKREIVTAVRRLTEMGKATTARKLRAYVRAAYSCAVRADSDPTLPAAFIAYNVAHNPVEGMAAIKAQADKNPLTVSELRAYWRALRSIEGRIGAALRLQILSGGQRVLQLARLQAPRDVAGGSLRLLDPKGKRGEPREHLVPVTPSIRRELAILCQKGYVLSTDNGETPMHATSLSAWAAEAGASAGIKDFQLKRVRSGIETALAAAGVSREVRGQLQSHGISGVQATHYDGYHYLPEKKKALGTLQKLLAAGAK